MEILEDLYFFVIAVHSGVFLTTNLPVLHQLRKSVLEEISVSQSCDQPHPRPEIELSRDLATKDVLY
jgi:hypothetical protein